MFLSLFVEQRGPKIAENGPKMASNGQSYGYITAIDESTYTIDHLHRKLKSLDTEWKYPSTEDVQQVEKAQIVRCEVEGEWDIAPDKRKRIFVLKNRNKIVESVRNHVI